MIGPSNKIKKLIVKHPIILVFLVIAVDLFIAYHLGLLQVGIAKITHFLERMLHNAGWWGSK